ncbi:MAG: TIGR00730 family Rossman fold protein [Pelagibacteraceae bacterium]|nr:TIGR00730 family Rossman fold protein [Pelagibacteraceae bacterium]|tara:strand:+ start:17276 stop:17827 length:552 start_codon:yes stop_codon:yes gene_type:complete
MNIKSLTIYCSSSNNLDSGYYLISEKITRVIGDHDLSIIYGGGKVGIMGVIAKKAIKLNIHVTGVIPKFLNNKEIMFKKINKIKVVSNMNERKKLLYELGDAFLALPGGTGTIEEISEIISWKVLGLHNKPIIFFNINKFWDPLLKQFDNINKKNFGNINLQTIFQTVNNLHQFKKILKSWKK